MFNEKEYVKKWRSENKERIKELSKQWRNKNPEKVLWFNARRRAKKKGIEFSIEPSDIIIPDFCPVLGIKLNKFCGRGKEKNDSPSIDRIVPNKGYTKDNIRVISWRANTLKNNASFEEMKCVYEDLKRLKADDVSFLG